MNYNIPDAIVTFLSSNGLGSLSSLQRLTGGNIHQASRILTSSNSSFILKQSMTLQYGKVPHIFFDAYNEVKPLHEGWWDRLELLTIRQLMAVIAFFGNEYNTVEQLHHLLRKFG